MRKIAGEQQTRKVENIGNFILIVPKFGFIKIGNNKYKLLKIKEGLEVSTDNLKCENYTYVTEFEKFSKLPKKYLIEIFESEYKDWFINNLEKLYPNNIEGPDINEQIVLKICMSFPETFYKLYHGDNKGCKFKEGCEFIGIGGDNKVLIKDFYENVRCELYHFGSIKGNRYIDYENNEKSSNVIYKKGESNCINLAEFTKKIKESMNKYISELKNDENLYNIFLENYVKDLDNYLK